MSSPFVTHWDDVETRRAEMGPMRAAWRDLGTAAGTVGVGLRRIDIDPGGRSTPVHVHGAEEEIFYVLAGSGVSWQDGATYEVSIGDCIVHRFGREAHTLIAGEAGLDVLAFGSRVPVEASYLPRAGVAWLSPTWVDAGGEHPWAREAAAGELELPPPSPRPPTIVATNAVAAEEGRRGDCHRIDRDLGRAAGSQVAGLRHLVTDSGMLSGPPHVHSAEEELFVVLSGEGTMLLGDEEHPVHAGSVVGRPPGTGVAHALRAEAGPITYLAYGTRVPYDTCFYPRSGKILLGGLVGPGGIGAMFRTELLDYWDGEE